MIVVVKFKINIYLYIKIVYSHNNDISLQNYSVLFYIYLLYILDLLILICAKL